jgi:hypothetical protein
VLLPVYVLIAWQHTNLEFPFIVICQLSSTEQNISHVAMLLLVFSIFLETFTSVKYEYFSNNWGESLQLWKFAAIVAIGWHKSGPPAWGLDGGANNSSP